MTNKELARLEDARVTLLTGSTFFPYKNSLARSAGLGHQSMRERSWLGQRFVKGKGVNFFVIQTLAKVESAGKVPLCRGKAFLLGNGALAEWQNYLEILLGKRSSLKTFVLGSS